MLETIAASSRLKARITGVVYFLYFLTAVSAEVFVGRGRLAAYDAVNLLADGFYIAVALLFYYMFKPVNRSLSRLAAVFSLAGCANEVLRLLNLAPYKINSLVFFRALLPPARLPHFQIDLPASNSGRADGVCRFGLADFSVTAWEPPVHLP